MTSTFDRGFSRRLGFLKSGDLTPVATVTINFLHNRSIWMMSFCIYCRDLSGFFEAKPPQSSSSSRAPSRSSAYCIMPRCRTVMRRTPRSSGAHHQTGNSFSIWCSLTAASLVLEPRKTRSTQRVGLSKKYFIRFVERWCNDDDHHVDEKEEEKEQRNIIWTA